MEQFWLTRIVLACIIVPKILFRLTTFWTKTIWTLLDSPDFILSRCNLSGEIQTTTNSDQSEPFIRTVTMATNCVLHNFSAYMCWARCDREEDSSSCTRWCLTQSVLGSLLHLLGRPPLLVARGHARDRKESKLLERKGRSVFGQQALQLIFLDPAHRTKQAAIVMTTRVLNPRQAAWLYHLYNLHNCPQAVCLGRINGD